MNILPALHHHLTQHFPYEWEVCLENINVVTNVIRTTIHTQITPRLHATHIITITLDDNLLTIIQETGPDSHPHIETTIIDLLEPNIDFITQIHQIIQNL